MSFFVLEKKHILHVCYLTATHLIKVSDRNKNLKEHFFNVRLIGKGKTNKQKNILENICEVKMSREKSAKSCIYKSQKQFQNNVSQWKIGNILNI